MAGIVTIDYDSDSCDEMIDLIYSESEKEKLVKLLLCNYTLFIVIHYFNNCRILVMKC